MTTPNAAPPETPSTEGSASGFRVSAWKATPATARAVQGISGHAGGAAVADRGQPPESRPPLLVDRPRVGTVVGEEDHLGQPRHRGLEAIAWPRVSIGRGDGVPAGEPDQLGHERLA